MRGSGEKGDKANIAVTTLWGRKGDNLVLIKHYTVEKQGGKVVLVTLWETRGGNLVVYTLLPRIGIA